MIYNLIINLLYFIKIISFTFFFSKYILNNYRILNDLYIYISNNCLIISYNLLYFFSKCQIYYNKLILKINKLVKYFDEKNILNTNNYVNDLEFIKNNKITKMIKKEDLLENIKNIDFDFMIHTDYSQINNKYFYLSNDLFIHLNICLNKKIYYKNPDNYNYEISQVKFILVELRINKHLYKINLKTDDYNFYIVHNVLNKDFFMFYLENFLKDYDEQYNEQYNDNIKNTEDLYIVKIIDQDVKVFEIDLDKQFIIINKKDYNIENK